MDRISEQRLRRLLDSVGHNSHSHLYELGDKQWFWETGHEALIVYRTAGKRRIVLGDPIGTPEAVRRVLGQFMDDCRRTRHVPVFYQAKAEFLPYYKEMGLLCAKFGEEAQVDLPDFHLNGKKWLKLRTRINKFTRSGYTLKVHYPPYTASFLSRLQAISDDWLDGRKEKSFSVGSFSPEYVSRFPVAVLTGPDGTEEAFVTLAGDHRPHKASRGSDARRQLTVDLMRYTKACPHGTMDFLFLSLFLWAKEQGYGVCSLGMAPLAGADELLLARLFYKYGCKLYNFRGLYEYKNKFAPRWESVYLAYPPASLPVTIASLAYIIHRPYAGKAAEQPALPGRYEENPILRKRA
ncbi:DUF2156 domain-containing protein [Paenibacillus sp. N4]|uniref:phosphatidylglycerol lysyltransferase domain-containing protein n=1 Tax=Paenibacillus vietnamensis TaxID=2590547 RepID=UPI001CD13442|nr:phosphatidylglycerol lysyltransferase domain-containing protein [Paenibacillus vietnamensis]MCA0756286.1 DUF2156 domain-containing protein [Paenibacillus vietnamensis]